MAKRKTDSVLGLPALSPYPTFGSSMSLVQRSNRRGLTKREQSILAELHEQQMAIDAMASKGMFGMEKMNEAKRAAHMDMAYTLQVIEETKADTTLTTYQAAFEEFSNRMAILGCRNSLGVLEVSANLIGEEVTRPLYPFEEEDEEEEEAPAPPKTFWQALLGG